MTNHRGDLAPIKVFYIHDRPSGGGGESLYQIVANNEKWNTTAIMFLTGGFLKDKFETLKNQTEIIIQVGSAWLGTMYNNKWLYLPTRIWDIRRSTMFYSRLNREIEKHQVDIIHSNTLNVIEGGVIGKRKGIPHFVQIRELVDLDYYQFPFYKTWVLKIVSRYSDMLIANSQRTKEGLIKLRVDPNKIRVIYNTLDAPKKQLDIRSLLNLSSGTKIVAIVGWITPNKMVEDFIAIAKQFEIRKDTKFLIIGGWGGNKNYNKKIEKLLEGTKNIINTGVIPNVTQYMGSFDVLICTCYTESFGRTVAESLISGTPAIGVESCAVAEIIKHGESGFVTDKSNIEAFVNYTKQLLDDHHLKEKMGEYGKKDVEARFGIETIRNQYLDLYLEFLNKKR